MRLQTLLILVMPAFCAHADSDFEGNWAFELPDGNPAWLQITKEGSEHSGKLLWSVGSAKPVQDMVLKDGQLQFLRKLRWKPFGNANDVRVVVDPITGRMVEGKVLELTVKHFPKEEKHKL